MNALANLLLPSFSLTRMKFIFSLIGVLVVALAIVLLFEGYAIIDSEQVFVLLLLIPIYLLYASLIGRYNNIGKFQKLVYAFIIGTIFLFLFISTDVFWDNTNDLSEDTFFIIFIGGALNLFFGFLLTLYGIFKKGQSIEKSILVFLSDRVGRLDKENLIKVAKNHRPDFTAKGLVVLMQGQTRVITSEIDYDMVQPGAIKGAQLFEFSHQAVIWPE